MKPLDEELQEIREGFLTLWVDKAYRQYLKVGEQMDFAIVADMIQYYYESKIRQLVEERERCRKCNGIHKCSEHFEKHPCCGSTEYNRHSYTCINND